MKALAIREKAVVAANRWDKNGPVTVEVVHRVSIIMDTRTLVHLWLGTRDGVEHEERRSAGES